MHPMHPIPPHPPLQLTIFVFTERPTQANADRTPIHMTNLRIDWPYEEFAYKARELLEFKFPRYAGFALYRGCDKGSRTQQALRLKLAASPFDEVMEELVIDATYEEVFGAKPEEPRPRVSLMAIATQANTSPRQDTPPASEWEDENGEMLSPEIRFLNNTFKTHRMNVRERVSPSVAAKSAEYTRIQASPDGLLDGRFSPDGPNTAAYPIELFHPAFATYKRDSENHALDVPPECVREVAALMRTLSAFAKVEATRDTERELLAKILKCDLDKVLNSNRTNHNFTSLIQTPINSISAAPLILEIKPELGSGGLDPSTQVSFSYEQFFCAPERAALLEQSNCPSFLIGLAGPWIVICGAVMMHRTIVQRLSAYEWYACSRVGDDARVLALARQLFALRNGIDKLKVYYEKLQPSPTQLNVNRYFPSITSYVDENNEKVEFRYVKPLEKDLLCIVFLAQRLDDNVEFIVKFVSRYNADVHRYMAEGGFAPRLVCYQPLGAGYGDWALVAMERVDGETIFSAYGNGPLPAEVSAAVQIALDYLRARKYIMPDLRRPNVMLVNGDEPVNRRVRFVDFDWACVEGGGARYPFHLSREIRDSADVDEYVEIRREHEENMFERNFR